MKTVIAIIAAIGIATFNAMSDTTRIYSGHNATGSAIYAYDTDSGRLYRGHNATGRIHLQCFIGPPLRRPQCHGIRQRNRIRFVADARLQRPQCDWKRLLRC